MPSAPRMLALGPVTVRKLKSLVGPTALMLPVPLAWSPNVSMVIGAVALSPHRT